MSQFGAQFHGKSDRASRGSGKLKKRIRDRRRSEDGGYFAATRTGTEKSTLYKARMRGGRIKDALKNVVFANVLTKQGYKKSKITGVLESKDNRNFARLGIITKGSIINTELGKARVLSRPGQEGGINAMLVEG